MKFTAIKKSLKKSIPISLVTRLKRYLIYFPMEKATLYNGKVLYKHSSHAKEKDNICIFSHFDKDNMIDDYVINYIEKLSKQGFDVVFVSTAEALPQEEIAKIKDFCRDVLVKENVGYDFGAWQTGILYLGDELGSYDSLLLCNDSVYAPLFELDEIFTQMDGKYNFWGITDSHEIHHHIQSYFMVFDKSIISSELFKNIWKTYKVYSIKRNIILQYEIGTSRKLLKKGYTMGAYCPYVHLKTDNVRNATHYYWKELIERQRCPILKVELLRDNPRNLDISDWEDCLQRLSDYDIGYISRHLNRVRK